MKQEHCPRTIPDKRARVVSAVRSKHPDFYSANRKYGMSMLTRSTRPKGHVLGGFEKR